MAAFRIAVIGGDGIGPEVIDQAIRVADLAAKQDKAQIEWHKLPWSTAFYKQHGHMVAFGEGVGYEVRKVGGWKSTFLSGEGLVVDLTGPGKVYMQTRSPQGFLAWLVPQLPKDNN